MEYSIHCKNPKCLQVAAPTGEQLEFIETSAKKGMDFIMLKCSRCYSAIVFNPQHPQGEVPPSPPEILFACPCKACYGYVGYIEAEETFWGCSSCGQQWMTRQDLEAEITASIQKFPYRQRRYKRTAAGWEPVQLKGKQEYEYQELVQTEWHA